MKAFPRNLFISGSLLLFLGSCSPFIEKGLTKEKCEDVDFAEVFPGNFDQAMYRFSMSVGKNNFTGIAVIKRMNPDSSLRMVFMTETGLKYFDFEFFKDKEVTVHFVMDALNHRGLLHLLTTDFGMAAFQEINEKQMDCYFADDGVDGMAVKTRKNGRRAYYLRYKGSPPWKISYRNGLQPSGKIEFQYTDLKIPSVIRFERKRLDYSMELMLID